MQGPLPSPLVTITPHPGYSLPTPNTRVAQSTENMNMWTWTDINCPCQSLFHLEPPSPVQPQLDLRVGTFPTASPKAGSVGKGAEGTLGLVCLSLPAPSEVRTLCRGPCAPRRASPFIPSFPHAPTLLFTQGTFIGHLVGVNTELTKPGTQG